MKRALPFFLAVLAVLVAAVSSPAAPSPVVLTHTLPAATGSATVSTVSIHVENAGDAALSNVTLTLVPRPPFVKTQTAVTIATVAGHQAVDVPANLISLSRPAGALSSVGTLIFNARYTDAKGRTVEVPAVSHLRPQERTAALRQAKAAAPAPAASGAGGPGDFILQIGARFHFANPAGIAVDSSGNVYVANTENNVVEKYDGSGKLLASMGGLGSDPGQMYNPEGIGVDANGSIYVVDSFNNRVEKFGPTGNFLSTWGSYGTGDGQFNGPMGLAVDASGNIYVADTGNRRIQKFNSTGDLIAVWDNLGSDNGRAFYPNGVAVARSGEVYATDPSYATVHKFDSSGNFTLSWTVSGSDFDFPVGIAVDSIGKVYVANSNAIQIFDSNGTLLTSFGSYGPGDGQLRDPQALAVDASGNVWVADTYNERIEKFDASGKFLFAWESYGSGNGNFYFPEGVAVSRSGNVYVADTYNHRIQKFDLNGNFQLAWGSEGAGNGQFSFPMGVAVDDSGNVYVADTRNLRVQEFDSSGNFLKAWGYSEWLFNGPNAIAVDKAANVYVADIDRQYVEKFDNSGNFQFQTHGCFPFVPPNDVGFFPQGVALDGAGNIYATDLVTFSVQKLDRNGNCVAVWDRFYSNPWGIAVDNSADVYVVDSGAPNVSVLDTDGVFRTTFGEFGTGNGQFVSPTGVATDKPGSRVYVADSGNNRIEAFVGFGTTHFDVSAPSSAAAGKPFSFTVTALDAAEEIVTRYTDRVRFTSSDSSATLPNASTLTDGTGTFQATLRTAGNRTITAIDTDAAWVNGTSRAIAVAGTPKVADLTVSKHHIGDFRRGERGTYRITVKNSGKGPTAGAVRVTDTLPPALTVHAIFSTGWTCTKKPLSCTTGRILPAGASYPPITLTVTVGHNAPSLVTNRVMVSGGGEVNTTNDTASDTVKVLPHHGKKK